MKKLIAIALAVLMLAGLSTVAFAIDSPDPNAKHKVTIYLEVNGTESLYKTESVKDGDSIKITAPSIAGQVFVQMTVTGDYHEANRATKVYKTSSITIVPEGDIEVVIEYKAVSAPGGTVPVPAGPVDNGATSPDTGVNYAFVVLAVLMGVCGIVVSTKKLFN